MKQAILITAYKNVEHLLEIIDCFDTEFYIYIHFDKKSYLSKNQLELIRKKANVILLSRRYSINWGGFNHLRCILFLVKEGLKNKEIEYFHLISGQDYPLKSQVEFNQFLNQNKGKQFLEYFQMPTDNWPNKGKERLGNYNLYDWFDAKVSFQKKIIYAFLEVQWRLNIKRKPIKEFSTLYGGSTWWTLSADCLNYVIRFLEDHPTFLKKFNFSFCSEEILFQTIIVNSPYNKNLVNDNLRYIQWEERNGSCPAILDETDFENIKKSDALFARKFDKLHSNKLLGQIKSSKGFN